MKKLLALAVVAVMVFALASCTVATGDQAINITSEEGAGTRTLTINVPKVDTDAEHVDENPKYFPEGQQATADYMQEELGSDYEVKFEDTTDNWVFTVKYSFTSIDDYKAKTDFIIGDERKVEEAPSLTSEAADGGANVTFTEPVLYTKAALWGLLDRLYVDEAPFDPSAQREGQNGAPILTDSVAMVDIKTLTITVGDKTEKLEAEGTIYKDNNGTLEGPAELTVTGFVPEGGAPVETEESVEPSETEDETKAPATGDNGIAFMLVIMLASATIILSKKMVKAN